MKDYSLEKLGQRIKDLRIECGYTQKELAQLIGIAQNTIAQYESGAAKPSLDALVKLSNALKTTTDYLLCGID